MFGTCFNSLKFQKGVLLTSYSENIKLCKLFSYGTYKASKYQLIVTQVLQMGAMHPSNIVLGRIPKSTINTTFDRFNSSGAHVEAARL